LKKSGGEFPGFNATQHTITNHQVALNNQNASCLSCVSGMHYLSNPSGNNFWRVSGYYHHDLIRTQQGWKISGMELTATIIEGNMDLPKLAMDRLRK
jgi:hypothetical protein